MKLMMSTPMGRIPVPECIAKQLAKMSDLVVCDRCFENRYIDPSALAELQRRKLIFRGDFEIDVRNRIQAKKEKQMLVEGKECKIKL